MGLFGSKAAREGEMTDETKAMQTASEIETSTSQLDDSVTVSFSQTVSGFPVLDEVSIREIYDHISKSGIGAVVGDDSVIMVTKQSVQDEASTLVEGTTGVMAATGITETAAVSSKLNDAEKLDATVTEISSAESETEIDTSNLTCEDCRAATTISKWRWCSQCKCVLCERCAFCHVKEKSGGRHVIVYAKAAHRSNKELTKVIEKMRWVLNELQTTMREENILDSVKRIEEFKQSISVMAETTAPKKMDQIDKNLRSYESLMASPLRAKWIAEKEKFQVEISELPEEVKRQQLLHEQRLSQMKIVVEKMGKKLNEILHCSL